MNWAGTTAKRDEKYMCGNLVRLILEILRYLIFQNNMKHILIGPIRRSSYPSLQYCWFIKTSNLYMFVVDFIFPVCQHPVVHANCDSAGWNQQMSVGPIWHLSTSFFFVMFLSMAILLFHGFRSYKIKYFRFYFTPRNVSAPGHSSWILDWTHCHRTSLCWIYIHNWDILHGCSRLWNPLDCPWDVWCC